MSLLDAVPFATTAPAVWHDIVRGCDDVPPNLLCMDYLPSSLIASEHAPTFHCNDCDALIMLPGGAAAVVLLTLFLVGMIAVLLLASVVSACTRERRQKTVAIVLLTLFLVVMLPLSLSVGAVSLCRQRRATTDASHNPLYTQPALRRSERVRRAVERYVPCMT